MKTEIETGGFGGGFTHARAVRPRCCAEAVLPRGRGIARGMVEPKKDARPVLQHRTGASNCTPQMTDDSLSHLPRWQRWGVYAFGALTLSGILPMAAAGLLIELCDAFGWWLLIPMFAAEAAVIWRVVFR